MRLLLPTAVVLVTACGPSEQEARAMEAQVLVAEVRLERVHRDMERLIEEAPTEDSIIRILRGPLMDSAMVYRQELDERRRRLGGRR